VIWLLGYLVILLWFLNQDGQDALNQDIQDIKGYSGCRLTILSILSNPVHPDSK